MGTISDIERRRKLEKIRGKAPTGRRQSPARDVPGQLALDFAQQQAEVAPAELVLSYDIEAGVLVCGSTRRWKDAIKATTVGRKRFRFSKRLPDDCAWYIPGSRGKLLERAVLERAAEQLRGTGPEGPTVETKFTEGELGTGRSFSERERERAERAAERIERHEGRASKLEARAADQFGQSRQAVQGIPMGQPILVGHHSEARHRRDIAKAQRKGFKGLETSREAKRVAGKAATAASREAKRTDPGATQRRIGRLEAELRKVKRNLYGNPGKGTTLRTEAAQGDYKRKLEGMERDLTEQIGHWAEQLGEQLGADVAALGPKDFKVGGIVLGTHGWALIKRVNKTSLTVDNLQPVLRPLNPAKLPYDRVQRAASPEDDVLARRQYADYFAKAAPAKRQKKAAAAPALKWKKPGRAWVSDPWVLADRWAGKAAEPSLLAHVFKIEKQGALWRVRLVLANEPDNVTAEITAPRMPGGFPTLAGAKAEVERLVADGTYPPVRAQRGTSQRGPRPRPEKWPPSSAPKTKAAPAKLPPAAVHVPVMAGGGKPTRLELKVLSYAQAQDARLPTVELVPSIVSDDIFENDRTPELDRQVNNAMRRLKQAGYLELAPRQGDGEKRYRLTQPKTKKKRGAKAPDYPPLRKLEQYHFGGGGERGTIRYDDNGYTATTATQSKTLKTQKGAVAWLEKRIPDHVSWAYLDTPDERRSQKVKRGEPLRVLAPGEPMPFT